jgi:SRSO17 transposase
VIGNKAMGLKTKPEIALEQIQRACETDLPGDLVVIDAGYGNASKPRAGITESGKLYVAGIQSRTLVSKPSPRRGRAAKKGRRDASNAISVKELAIGVAHDRVARRHE